MLHVPKGNHALLLILCYFLLSVRFVTSQTKADGQESRIHLNGTHFRVTVIEEAGFVESKVKDDGSIEYSGYLIDVLEKISRPDRANFTFELLRPSGYGSLCIPQLVLNSTITDDEPYADEYASQYNCGQTDVTDLPRTSFSSDFYVGLFYIIPRRLRVSQFSTPISPPRTGRMAMYGIATNIATVEDLVGQQQVGLQKPACVFTGASNNEFLRDVYPTLQMEEIQGTDAHILEAFRMGTCELVIFDYPVATEFVYDRWQKGECVVNGKPIGVIGDPMNFGPNYYGIGMRDDIPREVVRTIDYWLTILMTCNPLDPDGLCQGDSLVSLYSDRGGTGGKECGYVQYPPKDGEERLLAPWAIAVVVSSTFVAILVGVICFYWYQLRRQRHRIRKRFVWQIARNIEIGPSPGLIPAEKLAEEVLHIGGPHGYITKEDLSKWINDVKMNFISTKDFDALWAAMDVDGTGVVDPIEFFVFLSSCGPEFEQVYNAQQKLPKIERLKLAARRLTNIRELGEEGVRRSENSIERCARHGARVFGSSNSSMELLKTKNTRQRSEKSLKSQKSQGSSNSLRKLSS